MNENFLKAVRAEDVLAAKREFNAEMSTRLATEMQAMRHEILNSVPIEENENE